jgi:hypothetical protein
MHANKVVALIGLFGVLSFGSWWMASAMVEGNAVALVIRAVAVAMASLYYVALFRSRVFQPHRYH